MQERAPGLCFLLASSVIPSLPALPKISSHRFSP
jgi:hypothetical protein